MTAYVWTYNDNPNAWDEAGEIEFTAQAHEIRPALVNLWVDGGDKRDSALASLVLDAYTAERLGNQLLAAAAVSRLTKED